MITALRRRSIAVLVRLVVIIALAVLLIKSIQRRKALEQRRKRYQQAGQALVRYVQLKHQCSEEIAYQRLATFVKRHVPVDDYSAIERMVTHDRQSLVEITLGLLAHDPDEIDNI